MGGGVGTTIAGAAGAGAAGYGIGTLINKGIGKLTGGGEGWFGNWLYDKLHSDEDEAKPNVVRQKIDTSPVNKDLQKTSNKGKTKVAPAEIQARKEPEPVAEIPVERRTPSASPSGAPQPQQAPVIIREQGRNGETSSKGSKTNRGASYGNIPTEFDDSVLVLMAHDRI